MFEVYETLEIFPTEIVDAALLEVFKTRLDRDLSSMVKWKTAMAGRIEQGPFKPL